MPAAFPFATLDVTLPEARALYHRDLYLVRPDHYIAWRGDRLPDDVEGLLSVVVGANGAPGALDNGMIGCSITQRVPRPSKGVFAVKLFYAPGASSMSIHTLLEEIGKPFEVEKINLRNKEQFSPAYLKINPKAQVPALLRDDGSVLTEIVAIATWLGEANSDRGLLPTGADARARLYEVMMLINGNMHPQGITRVFRTDKFTPNEADYDAVKARGREIVKEGLAVLEDLAAWRAIFPGSPDNRGFRHLLHGVLDRLPARMATPAELRGSLRRDDGARERETCA